MIVVPSSGRVVYIHCNELSKDPAYTALVRVLRVHTHQISLHEVLYSVSVTKDKNASTFSPCIATTEIPEISVSLEILYLCCHRGYLITCHLGV